MHYLWILAGWIAVSVVVVLMLGKPSIAYSVGLGALSVWLPLVWFAHRCFATTGALAAQRIVRHFYRAEAEKWVLTVLLLGGIFGLHQGMPEAVLFGLILTQCVWWMLMAVVSL